MVWESARACAYAQLNDQANLATPLQYLREHAKDGSQLFEVALLCAHDSDAVAKEIVARLVDPDTRQSKLAEIQDYLPEPGQSPWDKDTTARWLVVRGRPDVQAAIAKVGRIESYPIIR